jgi:Zn-dependent peptidase ImmA (M78 family)
MKPIIKKLLNEQLFDKNSKEQVELLNTFVGFCGKYLGIKTPKINLQFNREGLVTTASYGDNNVKIYAKDRASVDIMRSIAHELVHMLQDQEGRLDKKHHDDNNDAGSPIENEANAKAGEIMRKFGEEYPEIYV